MLVNSRAGTGDELRKLSPFELQQRSEFDKPVSTGHDRELAEATRELAEATSELKTPSYDPILPSRVANRIVNAARGNGCVVR